MNPIDEHRIPIVSGGAEVSHLALDLEPSGSAGSRFCVLYMHGFASSRLGDKVGFFRRRFQRLGVPFCGFDFQGHGASGGGMLDLSLSRNVADVGRVRRFLADRGYRRLVLFGSSMGGAAALWSAAEDPSGVAATIAIAPALEMHRTLRARVGEARWQHWQREGRLELEHPRGTFELGWDVVADWCSHPIEQLVASYGVPALIFQGKNDDSVDWRKVVDFVTGCRYEGLELALFADGDHRLTDRLDHLWRLTASFLEERGLV